MCLEKHHTKLHPDVKPAKPNQPKSKQTISSHDTVDSTHSHAAVSGNTILLSTARVILESADDYRIVARALLDTEAEESFISEHLLQSLPKKRVNVMVKRVGTDKTVVSKERVEVIPKSSKQSEFSHEFSAFVRWNLTSVVPRAHVLFRSCSHIAGLQLADPQFSHPVPIDCILGTAVFAEVVLAEVQRGDPGTQQPLAPPSDGCF